MTEYILPILSDPFVMGLLGLLTHFIADMGRLYRETGRVVSMRRYWVEHPYQSALAVLGFMVGLVALNEAGRLDAVTGYGVGYIANSVGDKIGKRTGGALS